MSLISKFFYLACILTRVLLILLSIAIVVGMLASHSDGELPHMYFFWTCNDWQACFMFTLPSLIVILAPVFVEGGLFISRKNKNTKEQSSLDD